MQQKVYGLVAAIAFALALAGCGTDEPATGASASAPASLDAQARGVKFAQCMRDNGVDVPDPEPGKGTVMKFDGSVSQEKVQQAMQACREWAPPGALGGNQDPKQAEQMRKFAQCMRDNGVEAFPDQEGGNIRIDKSVADDPDFKAANEKCAKEYLPGAGQ